MKDLLAQLAQGRSLSITQAIDAFEQIMTGQVTTAQLGAALALIQMRGPTIDEITGAATVMRKYSVKVEAPPGLTLIDTCGTGGDYAETFNISTAAAIVAAAVGRPRGVAVAKHGNRSATSKSGSSTVLEALGVKLAVAPQTLTRCLEEAGICFCFAPLHHPAMKHAAPVRAELGFRTIFNILGPLTNPAGATRQVLGVFDAGLTEPLATVLQRLGSVHAMVVHGEFGKGGLDELSTAGPSWISEVRDGRLTTRPFDARNFGVPLCEPAALRVDSPQASADVLRRIFAGEKGPHRDIVCLNAAAALIVGGVAGDFATGLEQAREALDSGAAGDALTKLAALTNEGVP